MSRRRLVEPTQRRRQLSQEEARLWQAVVDDTKPLPGRRVAAPPGAPERAPIPTPPLPPGAPPPRPSAAAPHPRTRPDADELSHGRHPGLDRRTAERMKRGEMPIEAELDLHGHILDRAHARLGAFIEQCWAQGRRCVLVVTGKGVMGSGVLKAEVPRWLNRSPLRERVIGFCHAQSRHGGEGALYVLIRRRRDLG